MDVRRADAGRVPLLEEDGADYNTTVAVAGRRYPDAIANGSGAVDIHHSNGPGITFRHLDGAEVYHRPDGSTEVGRWRERTETDPTFWQIPYGSLLPVGAQNMLVAGRLIGADRGAYGALRMMTYCNQTGEAAGTAVALALEAGVSPAAVDPSALRAVLRRRGAVIL